KQYKHSMGHGAGNKVLDARREAVRQFEASLQSDQATIDHLNTELSRTVITSPIDGRAGIRQVDAGNMVHASDANPLVVITQMEPIAVIFNLPQQHAAVLSGLLAQSGKLSVSAVDKDGHTVLDTGTVELVDNSVDPASGTIRV